MRRLFVLLVVLLTFGGAIADTFPEVKVQKINDRVYALLGPTDAPNKENRGYMTNSLAIIGQEGVILVDAGSHKAVAEHILTSLRTVTAKPVTHVLITHHHPDHHLGLAAFPGTNVISTEACAKEIRVRGRSMVNWMKSRTGLSLAGTHPVIPQMVITAKSRQAIELEGVRMELIASETAHTSGDMVVWLPDDGVLAAGDILVHAINPNFADGNLKQWIGVVEDLLKLPLKTVMPGHGPLMDRQDVLEFGRLIASFYKTVESIYKAGGAESDVRKKLDMARWEKLGRFQEMMGHNISTVWRQIETDNF
nr:MBL fold metallo-hydrolase [Rhodoferax sp.]